MKKLFLLPVIALIAVMAIANASAYSSCSLTCSSTHSCFSGKCVIEQDPKVPDSYCPGGCQGDECHAIYIGNCVIFGGGGCGVGTSQYESAYCRVPEFSTIGAGLALIGAGAGFWFIRKKRR